MERAGRVRKGWPNLHFSFMLEAVGLQATENGGRPPDKRAYPWRLGVEGQGRTRTLLILLLLAMAVYLGNQLVAAYINYVALRDTVQFVVRDIALRPRRGVAEGKERILAMADELQIDLSERQVFLTIDEDVVVARVRWEEPIGWGQYTFPFPFEIEERYFVLPR